MSRVLLVSRATSEFLERLTFCPSSPGKNLLRLRQAVDLLAKLCSLSLHPRCFARNALKFLGGEVADEHRGEQIERTLRTSEEEMICGLLAHIVDESLAIDLVVGLEDVVYVVDDVLFVAHGLTLRNIGQTNDLAVAGRRKIYDFALHGGSDLALATKKWLADCFLETDHVWRAARV